MKKIASSIALCILVSGCIAAPTDAVVTSFNGDSVDIQLNQIDFLTPEALASSRANADRRAQEICARGPKKNAEFASARNIAAGQYITNEARFYLCLD